MTPLSIKFFLEAGGLHGQTPRFFSPLVNHSSLTPKDSIQYLRITNLPRKKGKKTNVNNHSFRNERQTLNDSNQVEQMIRSMPERQRRSYLRKLERGDDEGADKMLESVKGSQSDDDEEEWDSSDNEGDERKDDVEGANGSGSEDESENGSDGAAARLGNLSVNR